MAANNDLKELINGMTPVLNAGEYVFLSLNNLNEIGRELTVCEFKEKEGVTVVVEKDIAEGLGYSYDFIASWITLTIHSPLEAVGLTAAFSTALAKNNISCNVFAAYYHDHVFVAAKDSEKAIRVLEQLAEGYR
ncbi:ACT domain-containing protein [uncultured Draconibacterium sp.]|uniref:ACT domain-containing protein n=1 Tax=uncultured Draconibacterium sp. TaxID=1573823 RepID=UPI002AA86D88|nr:ACT domain-containing protein [uncultured Draconibacterium sp.]